MVFFDPFGDVWSFFGTGSESRADPVPRHPPPAGYYYYVPFGTPVPDGAVSATDAAHVPPGAPAGGAMYYIPYTTPPFAGVPPVAPAATQTRVYSPIPSLLIWGQIISLMLYIAYVSVQLAFPREYIILKTREIHRETKRWPVCFGHALVFHTFRPFCCFFGEPGIRFYEKALKSML